MYRIDGFYGFPIGKDSGWYGSIGGFWRKSDGVRDPQFAADKGGQLTATLSHDLDHGSVMFFARVLKDKNQWVTDTPILNPSAGQFSAPLVPLAPLVHIEAQSVSVPAGYDVPPNVCALARPGR